MTGLAGNSGAITESHAAGKEICVVERNRGGEGDRNSASNRWPCHETLALLKIRSDMDVAFRESIVKRPLWDDVSRKLAEIGYHRSTKKCKEKFENIYKYHKRTKEGRSTRQDGKIYRFSDQLEALHNHSLLQSLQIPMVEMTTEATMTNPTDFISTSTSTSLSTSSSSKEEPEETQKKKRKSISFFENLMKEVMQKQEIFQKKFFEAIEKHEHERVVREEEWKMQELTRKNREHEILMQERSITAARDAALIEFLHKITEQSNQVQLEENPSLMEKIIENPQLDNGENFNPISSSRWPKLEVEALIRFRTSLDPKYQENVPKGPLWEDISIAMRKLGFNRSAKRCKEKWENINKYFKKVKEIRKKRPKDSKTCPYFGLLDALYKEKNKINSSFNPNSGLKSEDVVMEQLTMIQQE